jgi:hypothetical protein
MFFKEESFVTYVSSTAKHFLYIGTVTTLAQANNRIPLKARDVSKRRCNRHSLLVAKLRATVENT